MTDRSRIPVLWLIALTLASSIVSQPAAWATRTNPALAVQTTDGSWHGRGPAQHGWGPSGIYDPVRQRMVIFGGQAEFAVVANSSNLVWELSLDGTSKWTALTTLETPGPYGRQSHSAIYDPVRDRMIIYGGWGAPCTGTSGLSRSRAIPGRRSMRGSDRRRGRATPRSTIPCGTA